MYAYQISNIHQGHIYMKFILGLSGQHNHLLETIWIFILL